jgi:hypothetical protein
MKPNALDQAAALQGWALPDVFQHLRHLLEARMASTGRASAHVPGEAAEVPDEVRHADLDARVGDADGAHDQPHAVLLLREHVLDGRAYRRSGRIDLCVPLG